MSKLSWDRVCCSSRLGTGGKEYPLETDATAVFQKDAERILTSSAFRRLQGKTQVYPFPQTDFVRNRLTHTYEVAHIGRTIASQIASQLTLPNDTATSFAQIAFNACLLHDIGNPPFGHSGESSIREFFTANKNKNILIKRAFKGSPAHQNDLEQFDGNAQGFRIATRLAAWKGRGGLRLSAGTLSAMVKYPFPSTSPIAKAKKGKFGYMSTEEKYASTVFEKCGLLQNGILYRNPFSLIVEAADDIAYLTSDVQDAYRCQDFDFREAKTILFNLSSEAERISLHEFDEADEDHRDNIIGYLRSAAVSFMTRAATDNLLISVFKPRAILKGDEKFEIWSKDSAEFKKIGLAEEQIREECNRLVYRGKRKISLQVAGGRIIKFILEMQLKALQEIYDKLFLEINKNDIKARHLSLSPTVEEHARWLVHNVDQFVSRESAQIFWGMPADSRDVFQSLLIEAKEQNLDLADAVMAYRVIQLSVDFVAGTTDRYLSDYSRQWSGPYISS